MRGLKAMSAFRVLRDLFGKSDETKKAEVAREAPPKSVPAEKQAASPAAAPLDLFEKEPVEKPVVRAVRKPVESSESYTAADIEVLEGLEPVRRRPGMYVGGTDEKALHHLFADGSGRGVRS